MPTKEEKKALRKQKREERRSLRRERKNWFGKIVDAVDKSNITVDLDESDPKFVDVFNQFWPILEPVLQYAKAVRVTGPDTDKVLQIVIDLGARISTGQASPDEQTNFIKTLDNVWEPVKMVLGIITTFTDDNTDKVINKVIEIGDWITED